MADCTVQHVSKAASDELLSKFAEMGSGQEEQGKGGGGGRRRRMVARRESLGRGGGQLVVEKRSLLPVSNRRPGLLRQVKGRRSEVRMKEFIASALLLAKIEKVRSLNCSSCSSSRSLFFCKII